LRAFGRSSRFFILFLLLCFCLGLVFLSLTGWLSPIESAVSLPLNGLSGIINRAALSLNRAFEELQNLGQLRDRIAELEEQLARRQIESIQLREAASDYQRLIELLAYTSPLADQEFLPADVIAREQTGIARSIIINRGTRDGVADGMPVTTDLGLVGRIINTRANAAQAQLISDENSAVSSRLQRSRADGSILGQASGVLRLTNVDLDKEISQGDLVITSGLGGNFPADIVVGQVTSVRQLGFALFQEAEVRSLIDFETLELVLVVTSFEPIDLTVFEELGES